MAAMASDGAPLVPRAGIAALTRTAISGQRGRSFLWYPVFLAFGIWSYFAMPVEPGWAALMPVAFLTAALFWAARQRPWLGLLAALLAGLVLAKAKADFVATPLLAATTAPRAIEGAVASVSGAGGRITLILDVDVIEGLSAAETPRRLRLQLSAKEARPAVGEHLTLRAVLAPLPGPVMPGGFDYGRDLWFDGIGGTGRIVGAVTVNPAPLAWRHLPARWIEGARQAIGARVRNVLAGTEGSIAEALITGERGAIPRAVNTSFQVSGLAHVLSISGLHMGLVAGGVFWLARALLALAPRLALTQPIKKWAAVCALAVGLVYMLLAGAEVATQRSYLMIAVVFFAVLVDRPAISLRNLALAAIVILAFTPEAAAQASFQMSFMAVVGLAAAFEFWRDRPRAVIPPPASLPARMAAKLFAIVVAALVTTVVAGAMSSIPAAYHFGRLAPMSILANAIAMPVIALAVMPMAVVAVLLMPLGLEALPLQAMGRGIEAMIAISDGVAALPGATMVVASQNPLGAVAACFGAAMLCLLRGAVRLLGAVVMVAGFAHGGTLERPQVLIERTGAAVAIRGEDGLLVPAPGRAGRFAVARWLVANGEEVDPAMAAKRSGWTCAATLCVASIDGLKIGYARTGEGAAIACEGLDILVTGFPLRGACRNVGLCIDRFDLWRHGAHAIYIRTEGIAVTTARGLQGRRPWVVVPRPRTDPYRLRPAAIDESRSDAARPDESRP